MSIFKRFVLGAERWHYRVLGALWTFFGLALIGDVVLGNFWWQPTPPLVSAVLAVSYIVVGPAFFFRLWWSRLCMLPLVALTVCIYFYACMNQPVNAAPADGIMALAVLAFGSYNLLFVLWSLWFNFESYLQMSLFQKFALGAERWHYRVLGVLWACFGVLLIWNTVQPDVWWQWQPATPLVSIVLAVSYIIAGPAFCLQALWSRWCLLPFVVVSAWICFSAWLNQPYYGDAAISDMALAGLAFWIYSLWFIIWSLGRSFESTSFELKS